MAVTANLVYAGRNRLRYQISQDGAAGTTLNITASGAATPDLVTDSVGGQLKKIARANLDGYGSFAAGASTDAAHNRALFMSDTSGANPDIAGSSQLPLAVVAITPNANTLGGDDLARLDGSTAAAGILITTGANARESYLDIFIPGAEGA